MTFYYSPRHHNCWEMNKVNWIDGNQMGSNNASRSFSAYRHGPIKSRRKECFGGNWPRMWAVVTNLCPEIRYTPGYCTRKGGGAQPSVLPKSHVSAILDGKITRPREVLFGLHRSNPKKMWVPRFSIQLWDCFGTHFLFMIEFPRYTILSIKLM